MKHDFTDREVLKELGESIDWLLNGSNSADKAITGFVLLLEHSAGDGMRMVQMVSNLAKAEGMGLVRALVEDHDRNHGERK